MRKIILLFIVALMLPIRVSAMEFIPPDTPSSAEKYMPEETESFGQGLWEIVKDAIELLQPTIVEAAGVCTALIGTVLLLSLTEHISDTSGKAVTLVGAVVISTILFDASNTLIHLGIDTINEISDYGRLLLPVMTGALAAEGGVSSSAALYTGTAVFDSILSSCISGLFAPLIYIYLCLAVANTATQEDMLGKMRDFAKWLVTWGLKIILYVFTGYMGITGVVSGKADAAALKATKLTISGMVPVVGGILSDASETVLVSASIMKNAVGVYGLLVAAAIWIEPFLQIGVQYLLLKTTAAVCEMFGNKRIVGLIKHFSAAMGLLLAMTGTVCLMLLVSVICFMKGVA